MKPSVLPVDIETGEVVGGITMIDTEGWKQIMDRKRRREAKELRRENHGPLGKFYLATCQCDQFDGLKPQDVTRLIFLASHLNYQNVLMLNERKKMTLSNLPDVLGVSKSSARRLWKSIGGKFISEESDSSLVVIETFFRGKHGRVNERLTKFYIDAMQKLYRATPTSKHSCLGRVFQLLAYVSVEYNILCRNPETTNLDEVDPLTLREFCEMAGYDASKAHRLVSDLTSLTFDVDGEQRHFVAFVSTKKNPNADDRLVVVNPRVLYGGSNFERVESFALFFR